MQICTVPPHKLTSTNQFMYLRVAYSYHRVEQFRWVNFLSTGKNCAGLARPWGAIEQEVGELVLVDESPNGGDDVLVGDQLV